MEWFEIESIIVDILIAGAFLAVIWGIVQIIKAICQVITRIVEIKTFGSSEQYREFLQWKQDRNAYR